MVKDFIEFKEKYNKIGRENKPQCELEKAYKDFFDDNEMGEMQYTLEKFPNYKVFKGIRFIDQLMLMGISVIVNDQIDYNLKLK